MKKRFSGEQIISILREAEAGFLPVSSAASTPFPTPPFTHDTRSMAVQQGAQAAAQRCAAWGYSGAEPFGSYTSVCSQPSSSGCMKTMVTMEYQCTGDLKK